MNVRFGAHEFLETQELVRKLTGDIEFHAVCSEMTEDQELRSILNRHIQGMDHTYHQAINALQSKGINFNNINYGMHYHNEPNVGLHNPTMYPPNRNAQRLSDMTIATIILNTHKAGSIFGMQWANECVEPQLRQLHITSAVNCNAMAFEIWQFMNRKGFYQVPQLAANAMQTMNEAFRTTYPTNLNAQYNY
jgi:spore coat protein CotF